MNEWEWQLLEDKAQAESLTIGGVELKPGDRVRLRPRQGGDIFDMALSGMVATIEGIEQDYEGKFQLAVVVDDDPGRDMGMKKQPGHRFFFSPEEVEPLPSEPVPQNHILIAGIGNIFLGDDGFGVEVAKRLAGRSYPAGVRVVDFGIRGFDLAYALMDGPEVTILVDACPRGGAPGTIYVIEPDLKEPDSATGQFAFVEGHSMNPMNVLRVATSMGGKLKRVLLVGCEPESLGGDEGHMGLSAPVESAVDEAVATIERLVERISRELKFNA
jgi:hydrogenase maturation protease